MTQFLSGFAHQAVIHPYRPAVQVWSEPGYLTYRGLSRLIEIFDGRLRRAGIGPNKRVAFDLSDALLTVVALLAVVRVGATLVSTEDAEILLCQRGSFAPRPRRVMVDRSWFDAASVEIGEIEASDRFVASFACRVLDWRALAGHTESMRRLFTETAPILACTEYPASDRWLPVLLAALESGRTLIFVAPDPGAIVQTALLYGATTMIGSLEVARTIATIVESGEPIALTFRQVILEESPTSEDSDYLYRFLTSDIITM